MNIILCLHRPQCNPIIISKRIVKATSPWLNVVLLSGIMIRLPAALLYGLSLSVNHYPGLMGKDWTPLCHVRECFNKLLRIS